MLENKVNFVFFFWLCHTACGISVSQSRIEPGPWQWNLGILTTKPPRNPLNFKNYWELCFPHERVFAEESLFLLLLLQKYAHHSGKQYTFTLRILVQEKVGLSYLLWNVTIKKNRLQWYISKNLIERSFINREYYVRKWKAVFIIRTKIGDSIYI